MAEKKGIHFSEIPIRETPPTIAELRTMLAAYDGEMRRLFNTSGLDYRALNLKEKLTEMSEKEALELLTKNGNLVKRPFLLDGDNGLALVGFKEDGPPRILVGNPERTVKNWRGQHLQWGTPW